VLVLPLFLLYEIGVAVVRTPLANGADFLTLPLLKLADFNRGFLLLVLGLLTAGVCATAVYLQKTHKTQPAHFLPVLIESAVYALSLGSVVLFVMVKILRMNPRLAASVGGVQMSPFTSLVMAAGAGLNEELVFRAGLYAGLAWALKATKKIKPWVATFIAALLSSIVFSAVHHIGPLGDPFSIGVFTFRLLCGLAFATIFQYRGFAVAAWTHALYDAYVFFLQ
jgi:membrane protease YdiL (CAAX protease family)